MRRSFARHAAYIAAAACVACAQPGMPPGGPPDVAPPTLLSVTPESGSVNTEPSAVVFRFDEVVSERSSPITLSGAPNTAAPGGGNRGGGGLGGGFGGGGFGGGGFAGGPAGTNTLAALVVLSPSDGRDRVQWRRTAIAIEPRGGFRANTTYRVTMFPGLTDLRGNVVMEQRDIVFSTGPTVTSGEIGGAVFDWAVGKSAPMARVEAVLGEDSTFRWSARADSLGRYRIRDLGPGRYRLRAWLDANANRLLDPREPFDSLSLDLDAGADAPDSTGAGARGTADLYAFVHDTSGARIERVDLVDSTALRIRFDRALATDWIPDSSSLGLYRADSASVALGVMMPADRFDSLMKATRAARDSAAADTTGIPAPPEEPAAPPPDAAQARGPVFGRPIPVQVWVAALDTPLPPGEYRLHVNGIPALGGVRRISDRMFTVRPAAPPP